MARASELEGPAGEAQHGAVRCELDGPEILGDCEREGPTLVSGAQRARMVGSGGSKRSALDIHGQRGGDVSTDDRLRLPSIPGRFAVANEGAGVAITGTLSHEWVEGQPGRLVRGGLLLLLLGDLAHSESARRGRGESNEGDGRLEEYASDD